MCDIFRSEEKICIRLTASHDKVLFTYLGLGFDADLRDYGVGAQILLDLQVKTIDLMTNNPRKIVGLEGYGLQVVERVPIEVNPKKDNLKYLRTKQKKLGHMIENIS